MARKQQTVTEPAVRSTGLLGQLWYDIIMLNESRLGEREERTPQGPPDGACEEHPEVSASTEGPPPMPAACPCTRLRH
jgi:hypothetical protein